VKSIKLFLITILFFNTLISCNTQINEVSNSIVKDTLRIKYLDTILIGKQMFPSTIDTNYLKHLVNEKVLLSFKSGNYYYVFFNKNDKINFLSSSYWGKLAVKYLNSTGVDSSKHSYFTMIDYSDGPFLTGFYNLKDSIIITGSNLKRSYLKGKKQVQVNYFCTSDTLLKFNNLFSVGSDIKNVVTKLKIPFDHNFIKQNGDLKIVLMEATSLIDNAWYSSINPDCYSDYSNAIVLSFIENKLVQIQYLDLEYTYYIFRQKNVSTKDIHY
jgi:hypothetical protein